MRRTASPTRATKRFFLGGAVTVATTIAAAAAGCGQASREDLRAAPEAGVTPSPAPSTSTDVSDGGEFGTACNGLATTITGIVKDPAGMFPLYNVLVYVPTEAVAPMPPPGPTCLQCGTPVSGAPKIVARTDAKGNFRLVNAPVGKDVPIVIQAGKWRRQLKVPSVKPCVENFIGDFDATRMPRNQSEGDMPEIALATGGFDPLECLLRKIGIDDAEFTGPHGKGRVHLYQGKGGARAKDEASPSRAFWESPQSFKGYDMVMLACEGDLPYAADASAAGALAAKSIYDYLNEGGRVFATHYNYYWFESGPLGPHGSVRDVATWTPSDAGTGVTGVYNVDSTFPKGKAFAEWLVGVGASPVPGLIPLSDVREDVGAVNAAVGAQRWIYQGGSAKYLSFNTPLDQPPESQCGRAVLSDIHISSTDETGGVFPDGCKGGTLSQQEQALEFLLFDLANCVQDDKKAPEVPR